MLTYYYQADHVVQRFCAGPTGPYIEDFAGYLYGAGYVS